MEQKQYNVKSHWKRIKCPFFISDNFNSVNCEGCTENSSNRLVFKSQYRRKDWQEKYCMKLTSSVDCPIYKAANAKYE